MNEALTTTVQDTFDEVNDLRSAISEFALMGLNDPALGQMGAAYPFTENLRAFNERAQTLIDRIEQLPDWLVSVTNDASVASHREIASMALTIKEDLAWLETMQNQLDSVLDFSSQDIYQLLIDELNKALKTLLLYLTDQVIPLAKKKLADIYNSERCKQWLTGIEDKLHVNFS